MTDTTRDLIQRLADALAEWQLGGAPPEDTSDADLINEARAFLFFEALDRLEDSNV